jgi:hypothetical protein
MEIPNNSQELQDIDASLGNVQGLSLLKEAAKRRSDREHTLFLDVPSWDGDLVAEYRVVPPNELRKVAEVSMRRARNGGANEPAANDVALIVSACVGLYMKNPETDERVPIEDEFGHVAYNRIATVLGKEDEIKSNADAVRYLMAERDQNGGWVENVMAMSIHANTIGRWMRDPSKNQGSLEELLGEF